MFILTFCNESCWTLKCFQKLLQRPNHSPFYVGILKKRKKIGKLTKCNLELFSVIWRSFFQTHAKSDFHEKTWEITIENLLDLSRVTQWHRIICKLLNYRLWFDDSFLCQNTYPNLLCLRVVSTYKDFIETQFWSCHKRTTW